MTITKFATATLVAASFATASFAGTVEPTVIEEVEEVAEGSSAGGILLPLVALAVVAAVIASDSDS